MLFILKSLSLAPSAKKWAAYQSQFQAVFKGRNLLFDEIVRTIAEFYYRYHDFPKPDSLLETLQLDGQTKHSDYLKNIRDDSATPVHADDAYFFAALEQEEQDFTVQQDFISFRKAEAALLSAKSVVCWAS